MSITSIGYPTDVGKTNIDWANAQRGLGRRYWVGYGCDVKPKTDGTRQVTVSAGWMGAHGVADFNSSQAIVSLPTVASGTRWFLVGAKRNWNEGSQGTTFAVADDSVTASAVLPDFPKDGDQADGDGIDFQPLALVPLTFGETVPGAPIDLRVLDNRGNIMFANNERVMQYLNEYGQVIRIGDDVWTRTLSGWQKDREIIACGPGYGNDLGFGGASGWVTTSKLLSYARRVRTTGYHQIRITAGRTGSALSFGTHGSIGDTTIANISNTEFRPPYQLNTSGIYRDGNTTFSCGAVFNPNGDVGIIDGAEGTQISKRSVSDSEDWSFRANFEWESA